jgi:hypothetical protein
MTGLTTAYQQQALDDVFPVAASTDHIAYSTDGATEFSGLARTAVGAAGWDAATGATPSVKQNNTELVSDDATGAGTVSHWAVYDAAAAGNQKTDWTAFTNGSKVLAIGDSIVWAIGAADITLD